MEYMRLEGFLGGAVSKIINKVIAEKIGYKYKPNITLESFNLRTVDKVEINMGDDSESVSEDIVIVDLSVTMRQSDFNKLIEEVTT